MNPSAEYGIIHLVTDCDSDRAARSRAFFSMGYHAEVYSSASELLAHSPSKGIVVIKEDNSGKARALAEQMRGARLWLPIIAYCEEFDVDLIISSVKSGVIDFIPAKLNIETLKKRIDTSIVEAIPIIQKYAAKTDASLSISRLTKREEAVLAFLADGLTSKEIAKEIDVSPRTVEIHRRNILRKLHVKSTANAIIMRHDYCNSF
ncbi:response regulator transcription factor [Novosphingobium sp.]|uniref:response regulator transcription factor n=1 Tax=Novosphingobium sp. TaxID=1874826 RepID=UPI0035635886